MGLFDDVLSYEESLFRNEEVLHPDFLPEVLPHREDEVSGIADNIKLLLQGRAPSNLFIFGPPSMGKTVSVRYVFRQLGEATEDVIPIYVNCWQNTTTHAVFVEIAKQLSIPFPSKGVSTEVISRAILSRLSGRRGVVFCFDEIDRSEETDYLYTIAEGVPGRSCIILVTNDSRFTASIEPRVRSRLCLEEMEFKPYSEDEIMDILRERAKAAFVPGALAQGVVEGATAAAFERGDLRTGLSVLMKAGRAAEEDASRKITLAHLKKALPSVESRAASRAEKLDDVEKQIYGTIKRNSGRFTGEIYEAYKKDGGKLTERSFRLYLERLGRKGVIGMEETGKGFRGRSRKVMAIGD